MDPFLAAALQHHSMAPQGAALAVKGIAESETALALRIRTSTCPLKLVGRLSLVPFVLWAACTAARPTCPFSSGGSLPILVRGKPCSGRDATRAWFLVASRASPGQTPTSTPSRRCRPLPSGLPRSPEPAEGSARGAEPRSAAAGRRGRAFDLGMAQQRFSPACSSSSLRLRAVRKESSGPWSRRGEALQTMSLTRSISQAMGLCGFALCLAAPGIDVTRARTSQPGRRQQPPNACASGSSLVGGQRSRRAAGRGPQSAEAGPPQSSSLPSPPCQVAAQAAAEAAATVAAVSAERPSAALMSCCVTSITLYLPLLPCWLLDRMAEQILTHWPLGLPKAISHSAERQRTWRAIRCSKDLHYAWAKQQLLRNSFDA